LLRVVSFILKISSLIFLIIFPNYLHSSDFSEKLKSTKIDDKVAILNMKFIEKKENYEIFFTPKIINIAKSCLERNKKPLFFAEKKFGVSRNLIIAILTVESLCGNYKEKYNVASTFKTLIYLQKSPLYRRKIFSILKQRYPDITYSYFINRVKRKYLWAKKELRALKLIYDKYKINVFSLKGSWAGAFGLPQFLPSTFLNYAIDGDNDGIIDIYNFYDAIFSIANYLYKNGWRNNLNREKKIKVILTYNYSKLYANTVLKLSRLISE